MFDDRTHLGKYLGVFASLLAISTLWTATSAAQEPPANASPPTASIDDVAWIAGHWQGEAMGGTFEETWNPPQSNAMLGMFKFSKDDAINFYEILIIVPQDNSLVLKLKHFSKDLVGWEEKEESQSFPLSAISKNNATFKGLSFTRISKNEMKIVVANKRKDGTTGELIFNCLRAAPIAPESTAEPALSKTPSQISQVFAVDAILAKQRDQLSKQFPIATAIKTYVTGLDQIDFSNCPDEFTKSFQAHRDAWNQAIPFFEKHSELRGEMHELINQIRKKNQATVDELDQKMLPVMETWKQVERQSKPPAP